MQHRSGEIYNSFSDLKLVWNLQIIDKKFSLSVKRIKTLLQGFSADADSILCSQVLISGNKEKMNHNNLGNKNATNNMQKSFLREGNFNVLDYFVCCKSHLRLTRYRINKKFTCSKPLIKIEQQKLVNKRRPDQVSNKNTTTVR